MLTTACSRPFTRAGLARRPGSRGVSLIEVLVSILILSFGVLAMAAMMSVAARYNKTTEFRSVATLLANDYADRMRANRAGVVSGGNYDIKPTSYAALVTASRPTCAATTSCTVSELAAIDKQEWKNSLTTALPGAAGYASYDSTDIAVDLWVAWLDPSSDVSSTVVSTECPAAFQVTSPAVQPRCMYFRIGL